MLLAASDKDKVILVESKEPEGTEITKAEKQINFEEFKKVELIVKHKKLYANNQELKQTLCNAKDGSKVS